MAKLEIFQNGNFTDGRPVYQIGSKNADGDYEPVVFDPMDKNTAKARLAQMAGSVAAPKKKAPVKKKTPDPLTRAELKDLTKAELGKYAKGFGADLDQREPKSVLINQAVKASKNG